MGFLLIVTGPPGAGKSTVARRLADAFDPSVLVEGDAFFGFLATGAIQPWLPESDVQNEIVTEAAAACAGRFARGDYATVYDGVVGPWFLPTFARACGLTSIEYVMLLPSVERCLEGVRTRLDHVFSDEDATRKMHHEFANADIDDSHVLVDPPTGVDAVADVILAKRDRGDLAYDVGT
ncbi:MAG TPA: AAA family ATPase [Acidimicrobiales bacterium]|jgi:predicted ABC-type ATPase|nr:AAA family ATPase [Acidimicrobiales bacterium]